MFERIAKLFSNLIFPQEERPKEEHSAGVMVRSFPSEEAKDRLREFLPDLERLHKMEHDYRIEAAAGKVSADGMRIPVSGIGLPCFDRIRYPGFGEDQEALTAAAKIWDNRKNFSSDDWLIAHGTRSGAEFCQILLDGSLKHGAHHESYGSLATGTKASVQGGGYWDNGWGVFVLSRRSFNNNSQNTGKFVLVPLEACRAIVLPEGILSTACRVFPQWAHKLRSHARLTQELIQEATVEFT